MKKFKNILIAPLDWGLGHATRCIPIIQQLEKEYTIFIGSSGGAADLLKKEFPQHKHLSLPSYNISYPVRRKMTLHMALQLPSIISAIAQEKKACKEIIRKHKIDLIISDNRYGLYSKIIPTIFITHQVNIKSPSFNKLINRLNHKYIQKFSACWIPDFENENNLGGELSHPPLDNHRSVYIGTQTRFHQQELEKTEDLTVVLSGPEPQRTLFEDELFKQLLLLTELKINVVRGIYKTNVNEVVNNIQVYDHLETEELENILHRSKHIICRSGYSSLMDLQMINAKILFVPTPQQTEQEYLAKLHSYRNNNFCQKQSELNILEFLKTNHQEREMKNFSEFNFTNWIENNI